MVFYSGSSFENYFNKYSQDEKVQAQKDHFPKKL